MARKPTTIGNPTGRKTNYGWDGEVENPTNVPAKRNSEETNYLLSEIDQAPLARGLGRAANMRWLWEDGPIYLLRRPNGSVSDYTPISRRSTPTTAPYPFWCWADAVARARPTSNHPISASSHRVEATLRRTQHEYLAKSAELLAALLVAALYTTSVSAAYRYRVRARLPWHGSSCRPETPATPRGSFVTGRTGGPGRGGCQ